MQSLSAKGLQGGLGVWAEPAGFGLESGAVGGIAQDLMGAAGLQGAGEQAGDRLAVAAGKAFQQLPMGDRIAAAGAHGALVAGVRMAVERGVDATFRAVRRAPDEGEIASPQTASSKSGNRFCVRTRFVLNSERAFRAADRCPLSLKARW